MRSTPNGLKASIMALAKAGKEPVQPDSPTPLAPSKLSSVPNSTVALFKALRSPARGLA